MNFDGCFVVLKALPVFISDLHRSVVHDSVIHKLFRLQCHQVSPSDLNTSNLFVLWIHVCQPLHMFHPSLRLLVMRRYLQHASMCKTAGKISVLCHAQAVQATAGCGSLQWRKQIHTRALTCSLSAKEKLARPACPLRVHRTAVCAGGACGACFGALSSLSLDSRSTDCGTAALELAARRGFCCLRGATCPFLLAMWRMARGIGPGSSLRLVDSGAGLATRFTKGRAGL